MPVPSVFSIGCDASSVLFVSFRLGIGFRGALGLFGQYGLTRQLDPVLIVDRNNFDLQLVTDFADLVDRFDVAGREFADVTQPIFAGGDFDESTKSFTELTVPL